MKRKAKTTDDDETVRYYLVDKESETHATIARMIEERAAASKARWDFMNREFPESKKGGTKSGWGIVYWESAFGVGSDWAIQPGIGRKYEDRVEVPQDWKWDKSLTYWKPRHSTKRGKELATEMQQGKYQPPNAGKIGHEIGCPPAWQGMALCSPGFASTNDGRYILKLFACHKIPKDCARISDIEAEKLTAREE